VTLPRNPTTSEANGARAVLGSQQPRIWKAAQSCSELTLHSDALRAEDGSCSGGNVQMRPKAKLLSLCSSVKIRAHPRLLVIEVNSYA
jgi:hypothetical protein